MELFRNSIESQGGDAIQSFINSVERSAAEATSIITEAGRGNMIQMPMGNLNQKSSVIGNLPRVMEPYQVRYRVNPIPNQSMQPDCCCKLESATEGICPHGKQLNKNRNNQRSAVKQKLEEAFRQNGFLVKTKQVSDGDATFCKFRQLRKYTRYYLKSWHQHLPEEVNKLWKGFLPPKSAKPNSNHS